MKNGVEKLKLGTEWRDSTVDRKKQVIRNMFDSKIYYYYYYYEEEEEEEEIQNLYENLKAK